MTIMTYEQEKESLARVLRDKIFSYKAARPNLSSSQIASKFGMSNSTFSRLENLDIKNPTFDQIIKVFNGTGSNGDLIQYLKKRYPEIAVTYAKIYQNTTDSSYIRHEVLEYLVNPETNKLMVLAFSECGLSRELVKEEFGNDGLRKLEMLIEKSILIKKDDRYYPHDKNMAIVPTQKDTKKLVELSLKDFYDLSGFEEGSASNFLSFQSESIDSERVYPHIISLLKEMNQRIRSIFNDPENRGDETVFVSLISDTVLKNDLVARKKQLKGKLQ